ncbi:hypothetical protein [Sinorhizobium arboris]|uniref:hypothetical protein n=1 Tax=Sinorhizobium arboris TaxID=76745 RepID=UPI0003FF2E70|nr:hypothetical protein [Sinorhizobium arboris]
MPAQFRSKTEVGCRLEEEFKIIRKRPTVAASAVVLDEQGRFLLVQLLYLRRHGVYP